MRLLKYLTIILLLSFWSCSLSDSGQSAVEEKTSGATLEVKLYITDWDAPKDGSSRNGRFIDPTSVTINLYDNYGVNTAIGTAALTFDDLLEDGNPDKFGTGLFTGLEAKTYAAGELAIELVDNMDVELTVGYSLNSVTLTAQGSSVIEFSSYPLVSTLLDETAGIQTDTLIDGAVDYYIIDVIGQRTYELTASRTNNEGDLDIYIMDGNGRVVNDIYTTESQNDPMTLHFAPEVSGDYYVAFKSFSGAGVVDYDYDVSDITVSNEFAISGMLTFPPAIAGDIVYIKYGGVAVFNKEIVRTGDNYMNYVIPGISDSASGNLMAYVDRDGNTVANSGDFIGYSSSIDMAANHASGRDVILEEQLGISLTVGIPTGETIPIGTKYVILGLNEYGYSQSIATIATTSGTITDSSILNFTAPGEVGKNKVLIIYDMDGSSTVNSLIEIYSQSDIEGILSSGDIYFQSDIVTITDTSVSLGNVDAVYASMVSGRVTLPNTVGTGNYVVFADTDADYTNGITTGYYSSVTYGTQSFTYRFIVPDGGNYFIGALVDGVGSARELTSGDYFGYLDDSNTAYYTASNVDVDFDIFPFDVGLTGSITLPAGINADGKSYMVGIPNQDIWSTPASVPVNTGVAGTFTYNLGNLPLGDNFEVVVVIDMDSNTLNLSPNAGDLIEMTGGVSFSSTAGEVLNFTNLTTADAMISGQLLTGNGYSFSNKSYVVLLDDQEEESGNINGGNVDYQLMFVTPGDYNIKLVVDESGDGIFGNSGDYFGEIDVTVSSLDLINQDITVAEVGLMVAGEIELPIDEANVTQVIVSLTNEDNLEPSYTITIFTEPDVDSLNDIISYAFYDVMPGNYELSIHTDYNNDGLVDFGDYESFYPFGYDYMDTEIITIDSDLYNLNYIVDSTSMNS